MFNSLFCKKNRPAIKLESVNLGSGRVELPVAEIQGLRPGKTLLITAGMDGDEYAGIEAAYRLADEFAAGDFSGRLIVLPIINLPGFEGECSFNPSDERFPKFIFPGSSHGTSSERLVNWLYTEFVSECDVWLDLHGGAITERVNPFLWLYETGVGLADDFTNLLRKNTSTETVLCEAVTANHKASQLAREGRVYVMAESGERGNLLEADILRHVNWAHEVMGQMEMIQNPIPRTKTIDQLTSVEYIQAPFDGIWRAHDLSKLELSKGVIIGHIEKLDGSGARTVEIPHGGKALWWKETMSMSKGDILLAIGN
ncbi:MAG: succinylglutamate desuccinylase/aspartoacylase family protein [bacterium]